MDIIKNKFLLLGIILLIAGRLTAQDSSFIFTTHSQENYTPTYLGNGCLSLSSTPLGCDAAESFMAGVYDEAKGDVSRIAALPEWNEINIKIGNEWLNDSPKDFSIKDYTQRIDMSSGVLTTSYLISNQNKSTEIKIESFVCRDKNNIAAIKFEVKPYFNGDIEIKFPVKERKQPERFDLAILKTIKGYSNDRWPYVWYPGFIKVTSIKTNLKDKTISIEGKSKGRNTKIFLAAKIDWTGKLNNLKTSEAKLSKGAEYSLTFNADSGQTYSFYKFIYAEKGNRLSKSSASLQKLYKFSSASFNDLLKSSKEAWQKLWDTDIIVKGDFNLQKTIHSLEYYLLSSCNKNAGISIPPMGLATAGYYGHLFWDGDTWMMPALLLMHPEFAKNIVQYRYNTLNAAIKNAKKNGFKGAMFPWEGDDTGKESIPMFAIQNATNEIHITGDVALGQWQYFLATGDTSWLKNYGWKVIEKAAEFWASRVNFNKDKNMYEVKNVVSVDEGLIGINNDVYTNAIAQKTFQIAISAAKILKKEYNKNWSEIEKKMFIPYDPVKKYNPTFENAPVDRQGSVALLLQYPLDIKQKNEVIRNNLNYAVEQIKKQGNGVMMGVTFLPIVASELNDNALFNRLIPLSYEHNLKPPFNAITETPENVNYNFLTGAGGFLQQVIFGYTGLRLTNEGLTGSYKPMLPEGVNELILKNFRYHGDKYDFVVQKNQLKKIKKN
ncbi:MAG: glycoside hydrolase family 65 protein [Ignavibacteriaceae bacterium]